MPSRIIRTPEDLARLGKMLSALSLPITVSWAKGADRSSEQNRLMWLWAGEVAEQLQDRAAADVQAEWKLRIGVPMLRAEDEDFRAAYDRSVKPLPYEAKIVAMRDLDFPVTRRMTARQMCRFLDEVQRQCLDAGLALTEPDPEMADYIEKFGKERTAA